MQPLSPYLPILVAALAAGAFAVALLVVSALTGPRRPTRVKEEPYECGIMPEDVERQRTPVKFYETAMLFIIFDIEAVFLLPWALLLGQLKLFGLIEMVIFLLLLGVGFVYVWRRGAFEWE
jgi:NADH-quinone oxidoreductase subunit A